MIEVVRLVARGRGTSRHVQLKDVGLVQSSGILAILGAPVDGTSLLFDVLDATVEPTSGRALVLEKAPDVARPHVARVSLDAPLPESLDVGEVCDLASDLRGEPRRAASDRLSVIGVAMLAPRKVRSLTPGERRAVSLAIALTSTARVVLVEEPLVAIDPVAPRLVVDALQARASSCTILLTTASPRDAARFGGRVGILTRGAYAELSATGTHLVGGAGGPSSIRIVVGGAAGKSGAARLAGLLGADDAVTSLETAAHPSRSGAVTIVVAGTDRSLLAHAVTHAIAAAKVDVELVEPSMLSLDGIRGALAASAISPPPGSLAPGPLSRPPVGALEDSVSPGPFDESAGAPPPVSLGPLPRPSLPPLRRPSVPPPPLPPRGTK